MVSLLVFVDINNGSINKKGTRMGDTGLVHMNIYIYIPIINNNNKRSSHIHQQQQTATCNNKIIELGPTHQCITSHRRILKYE